MKVLIAGMGNVLRGDDGFGVAAAARLADSPLPDGVKVVEVGIGGIHLVHELLDEVDALVILDAIDIDRPAGSVVVMRPSVTDFKLVAPEDRGDVLADMHYATPERAIMLARGIDVLPRSVWLVGCQSGRTDELSQDLSMEVQKAIGPALEEVRALVRSLGVEWPD